MRARLTSKDLWDTITGKDKEAISSHKATAELMLHVEESQQHYIDFDKTAAQNWAALETAFAQVSEARTYQLKQQLAAFKLERNETLLKYYGRLAELKLQLGDAGKKLDPDDERLALLSCYRCSMKP